jgi:hypothetical protein
MGYAVDTVLAFSTQAGAGAFPQTLAATPGDSLIVRGTRGETKARLMAATFMSDAGGNKFRIASPLLHDNVTGLTFRPGENPSIFLVPSESSVELNELDTLTVQGQSGAATTITAGLTIQYDDVRGTAADLYRWSDIASDIKFIKSIEVSLGAIAVGAWTDTVVTNTENQLHADKSYAVLGYNVVPNLALVGVKGIATGNLRMCGPGVNSSIDISDYFIQMSVKHNLPYIPVFQANDRSAFFVSAATNAAVAGGASEVFLMVAELKSKK